MKRFILILTVIGAFSSCSSDDNDITINEQDFLIFGHFYGECGGESCIEFFKLTKTSIFEDLIDDYSGQNLDFVELDDEKFEQVKDILDFFPDELLNNNETIIGCPDCGDGSDGGGLFIQYSNSRNVKNWRIDQTKDNVPNYLHNFIDKVNEKIAIINE